MLITKPRTPTGVMELLPLDQIAFQRLLDTVRQCYERYGFVPIETPVFELSEVLLTKSGGETERQVYFVQSSGSLKQGELPELALRFDLTVPLARYVAEHEAALSFPFRRYQIQRVYRGESAQRGRFREFYQADIDVIGKDQLSVRYDAELVGVIHAVFKELRVGDFTIALNHRQLMRGYLEHLGVPEPEQQTLVLREVDKLGKRGAEYVRGVLGGSAFGLPAERVEALLAFINRRSRTHAEALALLESLPSANALIEQGKRELREVLDWVRLSGVPEECYALDFSIARGLDYYTGTIYETTLDQYPEIGSICSGGRYENLAGHYTRSKLPGVGISIGLTRLFFQLREAGLLGPGRNTVQVLVTQLDPSLIPAYLELTRSLRQAGINTEFQVEPRKLAKQLQYADRAGIPFALIFGSEEWARGTIQIKDLIKGEQYEVPRAELIATLRVELEQAAALASIAEVRGR